MIKLFDAVHISIIIAVVGIYLGLYFFLKNKTYKVKYYVIFGILLSNFLLHFVKGFFEPYRSNFFGEFHRFTLENVCAVTTIISPFIFLFIKKENPIHDFMYFIMFFGGFLGVLVATEPTNPNITLFDTIRYFYCHGLMLVCCLLTFSLRIHKPKLKNIWIILVGILAYETIIFLNELVLFKSGLLSAQTWDEFFDSNTNNNAFTFGPTPDMEGVGKVLRAVTPNFLITSHNGFVSCFPVIWIAFPTVIFFMPLAIVVTLPFYFKRKH